MLNEEAKKLAKLFLDMESSGVFNNVSAATVLQAMKLSHDILSDSAPSPADGGKLEHPDYTVRCAKGKLEVKPRSKLEIGEAFMIDNILFMAVSIPKNIIDEMEEAGFGIGSKNASVVIGGAFSFVEIPKNIMGRICGGYSDASYHVVPYSLIETGVVKPIKDVEDGEMFMHGQDVFLKCSWCPSERPEDKHLFSYVTSMEGLNTVD